MPEFIVCNSNFTDDFGIETSVENSGAGPQEIPGPFAFKALQEYFSGLSVKRMDLPKFRFGQFEDGSPIFVADEESDILCGHAGFHSPIQTAAFPYVYWSGFTTYCDGDISQSLGGISPPTAHQFFEMPNGKKIRFEYGCVCDRQTV